MKNTSKSGLKSAFTLVELLVVIAIIGILAGMLLTVLNIARINALKAKAKLEANQIVIAIEAYDLAYGHFPVSAIAQTAANTGDFTYGGNFQAANGSTFALGTSVGGSVLANSEVMAILLSLTNYPSGGSTINTNYEKNPHKTIFLNVKMSGDTSSPGVGTDLVYRDPFGNPYIITMDLNYDEQCQDAFYQLQAVSQSQPNGQAGYNGLANSTDANGNGNNFRFHGKVMVWSAGPPKLNGQPVVDVGSAANSSLNKNHVLSW